MTDHYENLGVGRDATGAEIKAAFRKRAGETHPDRDGGDDGEFKAVRRAYEVLKDPVRRKQYDETGSDEVKNLQAVAEQHLTSLMLGICKQGISPERLDLIGRMRDDIEKTREKFEREKDRAEKEQDRLRRFKSRLKARGGGAGRLGAALDHQIDQLDSGMRTFDEAIEVGDIMMTLLDGYEYEHDEAQEGLSWGAIKYTTTGGI